MLSSLERQIHGKKERKLTCFFHCLLDILFVYEVLTKRSAIDFWREER